MDVDFDKSDRSTRSTKFFYGQVREKIPIFGLKSVLWVIFLHLNYAKNDPEPW